MCFMNQNSFLNSSVCRNRFGKSLNKNKHETGIYKVNTNFEAEICLNKNEAHSNENRNLPYRKWISFQRLCHLV